MSPNRVLLIWFRVWFWWSIEEVEGHIGFLLPVGLGLMVPFVVYTSCFIGVTKL